MNAGVAVRRDAAVELLAGAGLALALALWAPLPLAIVGLILIGPAHTVLELRYVLDRFRSVLSGSFLHVALVLITVVAAARLAGAPARRIEIAAAFALLAVAGWRGRQGSTFALPLVAAFALSMRAPAWFALVLIHLHNLVPLAFLWEWSTRRAVRAAAVVALVVVPAAVVFGVLPAAGITSGWMTAASLVSPPGLSPEAAARFFTAFAYMQTVHYVVWCWVFPRHVPMALPAVVRGSRFPLLVAAGTAMVGAVFLVDYATGRIVYSSLASYHAYLEFPVLLALVSRRS